MKVVLFLSLMIGSLAHAGGWISGGDGGLLKDSRNPWFLNNVLKVQYCLQIDEKNFGATRDSASKQIRRALAFWQSEFLHSLPIPSKRGPFLLAQQDFEEVPCSPTVDVRFQFGILTTEQKAFLRSPSELAAATIRTAYDEKEMRARGFIYFSPQIGPLAYNPTAVIADAWTRNSGEYLYLAIVHELGHVFGLSHSGTMRSLMSEDFVDTLISTGLDQIRVERELRFFSFPTKTRLYCEKKYLPKGKFREVLGLREDDVCVQYIFEHDRAQPVFGRTVLKIMASTGEKNELRVARTMDLMVSEFFSTTIGTFWLPNGQTVFSDKEMPLPGVPRVLGINLLRIAKQAVFEHGPNHDKYLVRMEFDQGDIPRKLSEIVGPDLEVYRF